jgi:predicted ATPase
MLEFELLEARTGDVPLAMPWRRDRPRMDLAVTFHQRAHSNVEKNNLTAIIGRNGTGKSHLLSAIVETFVKLEQFASGKRTKLAHLPLQELRYRIGSKKCEVIRSPHGEPRLSVDGESVDIGIFPLPERLVALTTSPFDKFVVPRSSSFSIAAKEPSLYRYLGLRDRTGRAALENLLFRSLNSLFETSENEALRRANIGRVFEFLNLKPELSVIYRLRTTMRERNAVRDGRQFLNEEVMGDRHRLARSQEVMKNGEITESEMAKMLLEALDRAENGMLRVSANFVGGGQPDPLFVRLRPLRRAGFLQLRAVEVTQANGVVSDLKRASSGQLSMAASLLSLASEITNGSLVLIDEPELSLHPEWQLNYIDLLLQTFSNYYGCHFVVATHSPMVVSELPEHATVISLDEFHIPSTEKLKGQSADFLLAEAFGLPTNNNRYVKDRIVTALRLAADGKAATDEFKTEVAHLRRFIPGMDRDNPVRGVIEGLEEVMKETSQGGKP